MAVITNFSASLKKNFKPTEFTTTPNQKGHELYPCTKSYNPPCAQASGAGIQSGSVRIPEPHVSTSEC